MRARRAAGGSMTYDPSDYNDFDAVSRENSDVMELAIGASCCYWCRISVWQLDLVAYKIGHFRLP